MIADAQGEEWTFRHSPTIVRPLAAIGGVTPEGIPYLAPEIQLLYKAKGRRPKDEADFVQTLPSLSKERRQWLQNGLTMIYPQRPWLDRLDSN